MHYRLNSDTWIWKKKLCQSQGPESWIENTPQYSSPLWLVGLRPSKIVTQVTTGDAHNLKDRWNLEHIIWRKEMHSWWKCVRRMHFVSYFSGVLCHGLKRRRTKFHRFPPVEDPRYATAAVTAYNGNINRVCLNSHPQIAASTPPSQSIGWVGVGDVWIRMYSSSNKLMR